MTHLSPRAQQLARSLAATLELIKDHSKAAPHETEYLYALLVAHLRSCAAHLLIEVPT